MMDVLPLVQNDSTFTNGEIKLSESVRRTGSVILIRENFKQIPCYKSSIYLSIKKRLPCIEIRVSLVQFQLKPPTRIRLTARLIRADQGDSISLLPRPFLKQEADGNMLTENTGVLATKVNHI